MFEEGTKLMHYKGGKYTVIGVGTHSETTEEVLVYKNVADNRVWVRPLATFYDEVVYKGKVVQRFSIIN